MAETVCINAVRTVTWPGDVTDLQGSVSEGVKLDGQEPRVIRVMLQTLSFIFYITWNFGTLNATEPFLK